MIEKLDYDVQTLGLVVCKLNEVIQHINDLEEKLLSAEERMEADDIKEANKALKRDEFVSIADLQKEINSRGPKSGSEPSPYNPDE